MSVLKAFHMSDNEIYAAETIEDAVKQYHHDTGVMPEMDDVYELSDAELDDEFPETDEDERPTGRMTTIRTFLDQMTEPGWLCGSD